MRKILVGFIFLSLSLAVFAQDSAVAIKDRNGTGLRAEGKIYVVLAVVLTILTGLFLYLIRLDNKIARLEKTSFPK